MRKILFFLLLIPMLSSAQLLTPFEKSNGVATATLIECLSYYQELKNQFPDFIKIEDPALSANNLQYHNAGQIKLIQITNFNAHGEKIKIFINNNIHPGEPDGVDACMMLARDYLSKTEFKRQLDEVELYIIPIYNTGGTLRRGCCSRANQYGPDAYGFRGNALNLDLNRDFIKCDAMETEVLENYFHKIKPHLFIDTHVSDGADYQYIMTLIASQHNKYQNQAMEQFQQNIFLPMLYGSMQSQTEEICPYVNLDHETPDSGITGFMETARYSSGYTSMFNCYSFTAETHMLKPFNKRVRATHTLLKSMIGLAVEHKLELFNSLNDADKIRSEQNSVALKWQLDTSRFENLLFKGYHPYYDLSKTTGQQQLYYDRNRPTKKNIKFFDTYQIAKSVTYPKAYVMPYDWYVKLNLERYNLKIIITHDTIINVKEYTNVNYTVKKTPYEGNVGVLFNGCDVITTSQKLDGNWVLIKLSDNIRFKRFLAEALEPESPEGFFAWGKMNSFLQQKEGFSDYVWDKRAESILANDSSLNLRFEAQKKDPAFNADKDKQLNFIYQNSRYFEPSYLKYPIFRIEN